MDISYEVQVTGRCVFRVLAPFATVTAARQHAGCLIRAKSLLFITCADHSHGSRQTLHHRAPPLLQQVA